MNPHVKFNALFPQDFAEPVGLPAVDGQEQEIVMSDILPEGTLDMQESSL